MRVLKIGSGENKWEIIEQHRIWVPYSVTHAKGLGNVKKVDKAKNITVCFHVKVLVFQKMFP